MRKTIIIIVVLLLLLAGGWFIYSQQTDTSDLPSTVPETDEEAKVDTSKQEEEEEVAEEDPYEIAETVYPIQERNMVMHETFEVVLEEVFEREPKLVDSGDILALSYVVDRIITPDDVSQISELLEEEGYELEGVETEDDSYDLNLSAEILEQEYEGNIYVLVHTAEEGETAQRIEVRIL